jgi:hypothetical protein
MTVMDPSGGGAVTPGSQQWHQLHAQRAGELGNPRPVPQQVDGTPQQADSFGAPFREPFALQGRSEPRAPRRPFNWRPVAWILAGLAVMWTIGTVIDLVTGYANPAAPLVFAIVSGVLALMAWAKSRHR